MTYEIINGDCLKVLPSIPDTSIDAIISDPPYPEIARDYGKLSEQDWQSLMDEVVTHAKRVLKPQGSAVFILQPNYRHVGEMRLWLWEFLIRTAKDWNLVQPVYWWRFDALPNSGCNRKHKLLRNSVKYCLWFGPADCYRDQDSVLWTPSDSTLASERAKRLRVGREDRPSGNSVNELKVCDTWRERGGTTPFNLLPISNSDNNGSAAFGHGAGTPLKLAAWWTRYICPPGGIILDPFNGAGTMGIAAINQDKNYIGIEKDPRYCEVSLERIRNAEAIHT